MQAYLISNNAYDTVLVLAQHRRRYADLEVTKEVLMDFLSPNPNWGNWSGGDEDDSNDPLDYGVVVAIRHGDTTPIITDPMKFEDRIRFYGLEDYLGV